MPKRITHQEYLALVRQKYGPDLIVLEQYVNITTKIKHKCTNCGDVRERMPMLVISSKTRADRLICCYQKRSTDSYVSELEARKSTLRPLEEYRGRLKKIMHVCLACKSERKMLPNHIIQGHGCFVCAKEKQSHGYFKKKKVIVDGISYNLQGFEPQALTYMLGRGAKAKYIVSEICEGKPVLKYRFEGKERTFIPDFFHSSKNRIVEVKSKWTLGLTKKPGGPFKCNAAKAKAAINAGYDFLMLVMCKDGSRIELPEGWYNMSKNRVIRLVKELNA